MIDLYFMRPGFTKSLATLCLVILLSACGGVDEATSSAGGNSTSSVGGSSTSKILGSVTLSWTPPVQRADGSALPMAEIGGYRIYYGKSLGNYPNSIDIPDRTVQEFIVTLPEGTYFFVMTTYDTNGAEGSFSLPTTKIEV